MTCLDRYACVRDVIEACDRCRFMHHDSNFCHAICTCLRKRCDSADRSLVFRTFSRASRDRRARIRKSRASRWHHLCSHRKAKKECDRWFKVVTSQSWIHSCNCRFRTVNDQSCSDSDESTERAIDEDESANHWFAEENEEDESWENEVEENDWEVDEAKWEVDKSNDDEKCAADDKQAQHSFFSFSHWLITRFSFRKWWSRSQQLRRNLLRRLRSMKRILIEQVLRTSRALRARRVSTRSIRTFLISIQNEYAMSKRALFCS